MTPATPVEVINMEGLEAGLVFLGFIVFGVLIAMYVEKFVEAWREILNIWHTLVYSVKGINYKRFEI